VLYATYGGEAVKKSSVYEWYKQFKRVTRMWEMMKEVLIQDLTEPVEMLKKYRIWCIHLHI